MSARRPGSESSHQLEWNDRLQDWLDGECAAAEATEVQAHLAECSECRAYLQQLQSLDGALHESLSAPALNAAYDARLFAQIEAIDESGREEARRQAEADLERSLKALSGSWRRALLLVVPGIIAGLAMAFALSSWIESTGWAHALLMAGAAAQETGTSSGLSQTLQLAAIAAFGGVIGLILARWLGSIAE